MLSLAVLNSSVNLEIVFQTMFCWFHVATVDSLGVVKKRTHEQITMLNSKVMKQSMETIK